MKLEITDAGKEMIKTKLSNICVQAGGAVAVDRNADLAVKALQSFFDCMHPFIDTDTVQEEVKEAKDNGTVAEVVKK